MFGWLNRVFGSVTGYIDETVRRWITDLIAGLYGFLHTLFSWIDDAWQWLWRHVEWFGKQFNIVLSEISHTFWHIIYVTIPSVVRWASRLIAELRQFIEHVWKWIQNAVDQLYKFIARVIRDVRDWVIRDIWRPLHDSLLAAWHWILNEGHLVYFYITHPDKLVDLIWDWLIQKLEKEAWNVGRKLGRFFLALIIHNLRPFVNLVEDILNAIF